MKDGKFDDTQLNAYFDEILQNGIPVGVNFEPVTERQDEQTGIEDIKKLLMIQKDGNPNLVSQVEQNDVDLGAITQNRINASSNALLTSLFLWVLFFY